jgi:citrate lyase beta subunit
MSEAANAFQARRSFIFVPGFQPEMFPKALTTGADIVCIDLEDAIAPQHKDISRERTMALFQTPQADDGVERIVRINCTRTPEGMADLQAIVAGATPPPAIMLPKVKSPDEIKALDEMFDEHDVEIRLHAIIETNQGLEAAYEIGQASRRMDAMFFGGVDMAAELRCRDTWENLLYARSRVVHAAAGAGLDVIDVPYLDLENLDGMRREAEAARDLGFSGKGSIHPKQVPILNEIFSPTADEIAHAERIVEAFDKAETGLVVVDGKLIEKPVLRSMHRLLAVAERVGA